MAAHGTVSDLLGVQDSAALPSGGRVQPFLLQAVCSRLWEDLPPSVTEISDRTIRAFSDSDTALADYCGQVIAEVSALHGVSQRKLESWLAASFITATGTRGGLREDGGTTDQVPNAVLRDLLDRHLLASETNESVRHYLLSADRLIGPLRTASMAAASAVSATGFLRAAELALARGELNLAQAHAERVCRALPERELRDAPGFRERAEAESLLGNVACRHGDQAEALPHYRKAAVPSSQAARGLALAHTGDHTAAAAEINGALASAPRSGLVLLYAARASDLAGDNVSAKERAREAIDATDPPLSPPHKQLALALAGLRQRRPYPVRS